MLKKKYYCYVHDDNSEKGAKFTSIEELKDAIFMLFCDKMTYEEFEKYIPDHIQEHEE